jgi:heme/copper-type cytochrome/quinol oxidase subunit 2
MWEILTVKQRLIATLATLPCLLAATGAAAEDQSFRLMLKDHHFTPLELTIPADKRVRLLVRNDDPTPAEFESDDFKAEKVLPPNHETVVLVGPLKAGTYEFHDEYHEAASKSRLIAK